jgi:hypothetical protein
MAVMAGPPCTVRSLVPGPVVLTSSMEGSCYPTLACKGLKGVAIGSCGGGNMCCVCKQAKQFNQFNSSFIMKKNLKLICLHISLTSSENV